jgi:imidazole glycerol-phosphate synthase subunit HisH
VSANVVIVDSGGANTGSVRYAIERLGFGAVLTSDAALIRAAARVVLPGVGSAGTVMRRLHELDLVETLRTLRQPLLGICVGMQILFEHSREGDVACLGLLRGTVERLPASPDTRLPHMGWNRVRLVRGSMLLDTADQGAFAYFVHSFAAAPTCDAVAVCEHGAPFAAAAERGNIAGVQFHPERSSAFGARVLRRFLECKIA